MIQFYSNNATNLQHLTSYTVRRVASQHRYLNVSRDWDTATATSLHPMHIFHFITSVKKVVFVVVCLFVCLLTSLHKTSERICLKFSGKAGN